MVTMIMKNLKIMRLHANGWKKEYCCCVSCSENIFEGSCFFMGKLFKKREDNNSSTI